MDSVRSILPKVLEKRGLHESAKAARVLTLAEAWLQKRFPALSQPRLWHMLHCKNGEVTIAVDHAIAGQEIQLAAPDLQHYLHEQVQQSLVVRVVRERALRQK